MVAFPTQSARLFSQTIPAKHQGSASRDKHPGQRERKEESMRLLYLKEITRKKSMPRSSKPSAIDRSTPFRPLSSSKLKSKRKKNRQWLFPGPRPKLPPRRAEGAEKIAASPWRLPIDTEVAVMEEARQVATAAGSGNKKPPH